MIPRLKQVASSAHDDDRIVWDDTNLQWIDDYGFVDYISAYTSTYSTSSTSWTEATSGLSIPSHWNGANVLHMLNVGYRGIKAGATGAAGGVGISINGSTPTKYDDWVNVTYSDIMFLTEQVTAATSSTLKAWARSASGGTVYLDFIYQCAILIQGRGSNP